MQNKNSKYIRTVHKWEKGLLEAYRHYLKYCDENVHLFAKTNFDLYFISKAKELMEKENNRTKRNNKD